MALRLSQHGIFDATDNLNGSDGEPMGQDIGGTNAQTDYTSLENFARAVFHVVLGSWNATDDLDEFKIQQATNSSGGSVKDLTTDASGGNYDTDAPLDADGDFAIAEVRDEDLDVDNSFNHIRGYIAEASDTGTDETGSLVVRYASKYPQRELQGAAVAGSKVYVDTGT